MQHERAVGCGGSPNLAPPDGTGRRAAAPQPHAPLTLALTSKRDRWALRAHRHAAHCHALPRATLASTPCTAFAHANKYAHAHCSHATSRVAYRTSHRGDLACVSTYVVVGSYEHAAGGGGAFSLVVGMNNLKKPNKFGVRREYVCA